MIVYAESSGQQSTNSGSWTAIPGLAITLPRGDSALLILNIPNPYAQGHNLPGGNFGLQVNGEVLSAFACFTYNEESPPSTGRVPTTLSVVTPLSSPARHWSWRCGPACAAPPCASTARRH